MSNKVICEYCKVEMWFERAGRTNSPETFHCRKCDHYLRGPCDCDHCYKPPVRRKYDPLVKPNYDPLVKAKYDP